MTNIFKVSDSTFTTLKSLNVHNKFQSYTQNGNTAESFYHYYASLASDVMFQGLFLYKGTPMTQAELDQVTGQVLSQEGLPRYADFLGMFRGNTAPVFSGNTFTYTPLNRRAHGSGPATWFLFGAFPSPNFIAAGNPLMMGTVGEIGSGADLELKVTDIVSGTMYQMPPIVFTLPTSLTY